MELSGTYCHDDRWRYGAAALCSCQSCFIVTLVGDMELYFALLLLLGAVTGQM